MQVTGNTAHKETRLPFDFADFLASYPGGISPEEGMALARYAETVDYGDIVEIGSFKGKSAVALAHGLQHNPDSLCRIVCVEPHENFTGVYGGIFGAEDRGDYYRIMLESGNYDRVSLINLKSDAAARAWSGPIGLLFIDGDHSYDGVQNDVNCWESYVADGGFIIFDDSCDPAIGPSHVIEEMLESRRFELIERVGKITFLRKLSSTLEQTTAEPTKRMQVLVACHDLIHSGGLLRFERVARELRLWGHELCFATFASHPEPAWDSEFPVLTIEEALQKEWTATMVPGAGFPEDTINLFPLLQGKNFGYRVQHILNDPTNRQGFLAVNHAFKPDLVIFNNTHWEPGSFTELQARKFAVLEGAVDTGRFAPAPCRPCLAERETIIIGGLANKNPAPLIEALRQLPANFTIRLFGSWTGDDSEVDDLVKTGRLQLMGKLDEDALAGYYNSVDIVVHTEEFAGWANLAAEAIASGVPLICTHHGTTAFASHQETALVLEETTGTAIASAVTQLCDNPSLTLAMVNKAREHIRNYDWTTYTSQLAELCSDDGKSHYTHAPELGLHGKWPLADRFKDLDYIFEHCDGATVIDFGCAEGIVARQCLEQGAQLVHGLELDESRVNTAAGLCENYPDSHLFIHANLDEWSNIRERASQILLPTYDIVLYLGIQHHLAYPDRIATLADAAAMAGKIFAIRTTGEVYQQDDVEGLLAGAGFIEHCFRKDAQRKGFGVARIFTRG